MNAPRFRGKAKMRQTDGRWYRGEWKWKWKWNQTKPAQDQRTKSEVLSALSPCIYACIPSPTKYIFLLAGNVCWQIKQMAKVFSMRDR